MVRRFTQRYLLSFETFCEIRVLWVRLFYQVNFRGQSQRIWRESRTYLVSETVETNLPNLTDPSVWLRTLYGTLFLLASAASNVFLLLNIILKQIFLNQLLISLRFKIYLYIYNICIKSFQVLYCCNALLITQHVKKRTINE